MMNDAQDRAQEVQRIICVPCPTCEAPVGEACTGDGELVQGFHVSRIEDEKESRMTWRLPLKQGGLSE